MATAFRIPLCLIPTCSIPLCLIGFALLCVLAGGIPASAQDASETPAGSSAASDSAEAAPDDDAPEAKTTVDPTLPLDHLEILVRPLTKSELEIEAAAWEKLLREKAGEIATTSLKAREIKETLKGTESETPDKTLSDETSADDTNPEETDASGDADSQPADDAAEPDSIEDAESQAANRDELLAQVVELQNQRTALSDRLEVVLVSLESKGGEVAAYRSYISAISGIELDTSDVASVWSGIVGWLTSKEGGQRWAWNVARFLLILFVTWMVARLVARAVNWLLDRKVRLSQLAERLISRTIRNVVLAIGFAVALTALEIDITPIIAAIGATGLVVGLALQGTLSNFASGLLILINRPFDVGDVVSAGGVTGTIDQMNLVSTRFKTFDNQAIYVPNNEIWNNVITNITANETRRVDLEFGIGYDDDFEQAERIIQEIVTAHDLVLDDPEPTVVTHALGDSSVNIVCRPWAKTSDWWSVKTDVTRTVKKRFDEAGISFPYPQTDVHLHRVTPAGEPD